MKKLLRKFMPIILVLAFVFVLSIAASAAELTNIEDIRTSASLNQIYFKVETDKDLASYSVGDTITFTATLWADMDGDKIPYNDVQLYAPYVNYTLECDDGNDFSGSLDATSGTVKIDITPTKAAGVRLVLKAADSSKTSYTGSYIKIFEGGAITGASSHQVSTVEPADFDTWWDSQLAELDAIAPDLVFLQKLESKDSKFEVYEVRVAGPDSTSDSQDALIESGNGGTYVAGFLTVPVDAEAGSLKIRLIYNGHGTGRGGAVYDATSVTMNVNAHSIPLDREDAFYPALSEKSGSPLHNYAFIEEQNSVPGTSYMRNLLLRDVQAVRFLKKYFGTTGGTGIATTDTVNNPDAIDASAWKGLWDGVNCELQGGSQGGFQAIAVAGLMADEQSFTRVQATIAWFADLAGKNDTNKIASTFRPAYKDGLAYYDTALFAKRVTADYVYMTGGTGDTLCPMTSIQSVFNNLQSDFKTLIFYQGMLHGTEAPYPLSSIQSGGTNTASNPSGYVLTEAGNENGEVNDIRWTLDMDTGTLTFKSEGVINSTVLTANSHVNYVTYVPWKSYIPIIKKIVIDKNITAISGYAFFENHTELEVVEIQGESMTNSVASQSLFRGCNKLTTIGHTGNLVKGIYDMRNFYWTAGNSDAFFGKCGGGLDLTVLLPYTDSPIFGRSWNGTKNWFMVGDNQKQDFTGAKSVTFKVIYGSDSEICASNYVEYAPGRFNVVEYTLDELKDELTVVASGSIQCNLVNATSYYSISSWTVYSNGEIVFECTGGHETIKPFINRHDTGDKLTLGAIKSTAITVDGKSTTIGAYVKKITLKGFTHLGGNYGSPLSGWSAATTIDLGSINTIVPCNTRGLFSGMRNLVTVGSSLDGTLNRGVVDLSCLTEWWQKHGTQSMFSDTSKTSYAGFYNCTSIKKVILPAMDDGTLESFLQSFYNCTSLEEIVVPTSYTNMTLSTDSFVNCPKLTKIVFESPNAVTFPEGYTLPDTVTEIVCYTDTVKAKLVATGIDAAKITVETAPAKFIVTGEGSSVREAYKTWFNYYFNKLSGELVITADHGLYDKKGTKDWNTDDTANVSVTAYYVFTTSGLSQAFKDFKNEYKSLVTSIKLEGLHEFGGWWGASPLADWTACEKIDIGVLNAYVQPGADANNSGMFRGNTALVTVGSSYYGTLVDGEVNVNGIELSRGDVFVKYMLYGCSSVKRVILPSLKSETARSVNETTFFGCTALETIVVPDVSYTITGGAFDSLTSLKVIELKDKNFVDTADKLFPDVEGLTVICHSETTYDSIVANSYNSTKAVHFAGVVNATGFSIRLTDYNGLRCLFSFDDIRKTVLEENGLTFKEYGAMLISEAKLNSFGAPLTLVNNGGRYVPSTFSASKLSIYEGDTLVGKLLLGNPDNNDNTSDFAVTITNYKSNQNDGVYAVAYAVFTDDAGNDYIEYANYGDIEGKEAYEFVNIYDVALNMYLSGDSDLLEKVTDEVAVWGILGVNAIELENGKRDITVDGVSMMVSSDTLFVRRMDGAAPSADDINAAEAKINELGKTFTKTVAIKVTDDPEFTLKSQWEAYLDERIASANLSENERKRSFVFVTDTHWSTVAAGATNQNLTDAVAYASEALGGALVVHGGDLYGGFPGVTVTEDTDTPDEARKLAEDLIDSYFTTQLEAEFSGNYLYALGNHCTNIVGYQNALKALAASLGVTTSELTAEQTEELRKGYFVSDSDMYSKTIGRIDLGMGTDSSGNRKIVYDTNSITRVEELLIEGSADYDQMFWRNRGNRFEVTDDLITEAKNLMKMHYHYDDADGKVRYIVLDTGGRGYTHNLVFNDGASTFVLYQYKWLAETLKSTPSGYDIVVVGHQITVTTENISDVFRDMYNIICAFKSGGTVTTKEHNWYYWNTVTETLVKEARLIGYSFDKAFEGNIITIGGHHHADYGYYVDYNANYSTTENPVISATNVQFGSTETAGDGVVLSITTGTPVNYQEEPSVDGVDLTGTYPDNMRFDIITICDDGSVKATRIGAGVSREWAYNRYAS